MSRRRRLALRQVAEPALSAALSDVEDAQEQDPMMAEPNFNLLGMMQTEAMAAPEMPPTTSLASTQVVSSGDVDGDEIMDQPPTLVLPSTSKNISSSDPPTKKPRMENSSTTHPQPMKPSADASNPGVFQLYQTGLCEDHVLRLHFIRRRPPPPPAIRVEDEFVLPRPRLSLLDVLPKQSFNISDLLQTSDNDHTSVSLMPVAVKKSIQTATTTWRSLEDATAEIIASWSGLQECDWKQVYKANESFIPTPDDLIRVLETLRSDAFASFVWSSLLVSTLQTLCRAESPPLSTTRLLTALLSHQYFQELSAKDFRTQLRAMNLRSCLEPSVGAAIEMEIVTHFHKFRNPTV